MGILMEYLGQKEYNYYDSPEGEDCFKKLWFVSKYAGIYGILGASMDVLLYSHPKGYVPTLARYAYIVLPAVGVGAAFASTVCTATNLRGKDDKFNYLLGGLTSGAVVGAWKKSVKVGVFSALALGFAAILKKDSIESGWAFLGNPNPKGRRYGDFWYVKRDYTIVKDPGPTWKPE